MKYFLKLILFSNFLFAASFAQSFQIGHKQQTFIDSSRGNRNITTEIYYPSTLSGDNVPIASGEFPVLVFGHGFLMTWSAYDIIWAAFVPKGYILVFPTTETSFAPSHTDFAKDLAFLVGSLRSESINSASTFFGAVSPSSAVMGHSMGGGAAFLAVQYDSTITALVTMAAAVTNPSSITAATTIKVPTMVFSGANDCVAPPAQHQFPMYDSSASIYKTLVSITGGSHCQFASYNFFCNFGEGTCSPQPTITPAVQQSTTFNLLINWLNFYLKNDCGSGKAFQNLISTGQGITSQQNCALACTGIKEQSYAKDISISPNPFNSLTILQTTFPLENATLMVYNIYGQVVKRVNSISEQTITLFRDNLSSGVYLIRLTDSNKFISSAKLIIADYN